jgi:peptidoglycan/xylan/chitin deacetylase (PgdA/CDA1 family)
VNARRTIKHAVQAAVAQLAPALFRMRRRSLLVLMYHRVLPESHPDRQSEQPGMYVSPATLAMQLELLRRNFTVVHLDEWIERARAGAEVPGSSCAITFDDGWLDNYQHAWPVLRASGVPATIYLVSDLVGTRYSFWPNRLARLLRTRGIARTLDDHPLLQSTLLPLFVEHRLAAGSAAVTQAQIDAAIDACKRAHGDAELDRLFEQGTDESSGSTRDLMNWEEIRQMGADDQVRFGSHSRRHTRLLDSLSADVVDDEVLESARVIEERLGRRPRTFCFPNGDHSGAAVAAARRGYSGAVTTRRGWNAPDSDCFLLNRVGVHEDVSSATSAFMARLAGIG